jgi:hypothetical protein
MNTQPEQKLFPFARSETLVLATPEVAMEQFLESLPDDNIQFKPGPRWNRFHAASEKLVQELGMVPEISYVWTSKDFRKQARKILKGW